MKKEDSNKSNNTGCVIALVIGVLCFWGLFGMIGGHGFGESIGANVKALGILVVCGLAIYGFIKLNDK
ncbi:hypothetical protein MWU50_07480 [Flavobacteriaceae bacterium S0862]|nr:hypothetical protein [Flavobacteriaceae bacterium S0862]